jgi:putative Holliday junction resolvase
VRLVGIDFGGRRIGVAVSDATGLLARPAATIERRPQAGDLDVVKAVLAEVDKLEADGDPVDTLVVGLPRRLDGSPNEQTPLVEKFAAALRAATVRPVVMQDERLTSHEADARLATRERDWRKRKARLDEVAAAIILQDYLDSHSTSSMSRADPDDIDRCGD